MPLRPIDAIFVHPKRRLYVVYYRGELWQLPRMKIDDRSWQNKKPYTDDHSGLYLSIHQAISDPVLAQKLRTLNLPTAVRGCTLPRFEAWWEVHGFQWLKDKLTNGESPLAAHDTLTSIKTHTAPIDTSPVSAPYDQGDLHNRPIAPSEKPSATTDVFAAMLADLTDEVLQQKL